MAGSAAEWRESVSQRMEMSHHPLIPSSSGRQRRESATLSRCLLGLAFHALRFAVLLSIAQDRPTGSVDGMSGNGGFCCVQSSGLMETLDTPAKAVAVSTMPGWLHDTAGTPSATTPTSPHRSD